ncbi:glutamine synthetase [Pseudomonas psychrotolerans]|nr:glutamine synthetase [Pseudomonas psychrotolerans]
MLPSETQHLIDQHGIRYVLAQFVDIHGSAKTKSVPVAGLAAVAERRALASPASPSAVWAWNPMARISWPAATFPP